MVRCSGVLVFDTVSRPQKAQCISKGTLDVCSVSLTLANILRFKRSATSFYSSL